VRQDRIAIAYDCLYPYSTGGGERLYRSYAEHLHRKGTEVDYLTTRQWPASDAPSDGEFSVIAVTGPLRLYDADGVRRTAAALGYAWGLFRSLRRERHAYRGVIVSGLPVLNVFAVRAALVGSGTRIVVDYLEVWGRKQWVEYAGSVKGRIAWTLQRLAVTLTPIATCHSQLTARQLRREGLRGRLVVSPGLIDGDSSHAFTPKAASPPYAVYAGRHIPDKRVDAIPAAVAAARRALPDLRLIILGSGSSTPDVDEAIARAHGEQWTQRPGFVSQERLEELMANAAVLINPSRREGYGLVVVEASAHGTPVVLVDDPFNAATELVVPEVNGFIAASTSPEDLGGAIVRAVRGGSQLRRRARSWYETAVTTRTVARTVDGILAELGSARDTQAGDLRPAETIEGRK